MNIYLYLISEDINEYAEPMFENISNWRKQTNNAAKLINLRAEDTSDKTRSAWDIGLMLDTEKKAVFAKPFNFLCGLANEHQQEFVIGIYDPNKNSYEDILFFGWEEGKPDLYEIASYLGLPK